MKPTPENYQKVEILVEGEWIPATFYEADFYWNEEDEFWWSDYFLTDDWRDIPPSQSGDPLPEWRPKP